MTRRIDAKNRTSKGKNISLHSADEINPDQQCPIFSFEFLQSSYCISDCTQEEKAAFADRMRRLSQLTWAQIKCQDRHKLGCEEIARTSIRAGIPAHVTEDVVIIAFRFHDKAPMVGYRDKRIFHILWFDRQYRLYSHN